MKKIFEFSVRQPLFINLLTILILIAGFMSLAALNRDTFPNIQLDIVLVTTNYPGATPHEVEKLITIPARRNSRRSTISRRWCRRRWRDDL